MTDAGNDLLPTREQLAHDVLSLAWRDGMPEPYWLTNSRIARACAVLGIAPDRARDTVAALIEHATPSAGTGSESARTVASDRGPLEVWTDGACSGNPGPGGWGWVTTDGRQGSGGYPATTSQRMEVTAALDALTTITERPIIVVSDSRYVVDCFNRRWHDGWFRRGWKNSQGHPVANRDLWERLIPLGVADGVTFRWIKGHAGHALNEEADRLAVAAKDLVRVAHANGFAAHRHES